MDVPKDHFGLEVTKIIQEIADSHFVAFDLELSGVAGRTVRLTPGKPTLQEYYEEVKEAAQKYQILQFGLTIVHEDLHKGRYIVKPYNFNISQVPTLHERHFKRTWSMNSGAISFLLKNGFDFGKQMAEGVHFLSRAEEEQARKSMRDLDNIKRPDMILKPEDDALIDHIRVSVKRWMGIPAELREEFLNIPSDDRAKRVPGALNRYQIRLTHQVVQNEFPGLKTQGMNHFVQITNPSTESLSEAKRLEEQNIRRDVSRAVGFRWLLEAMASGDVNDMPAEYVIPALPYTTDTPIRGNRLENFLRDLSRKLKDHRKILIGHNCFTDMVNLHKFMMGWLPEKVEDFTESMNKCFPAIVDTKRIASFGNARWGDTSLAKVEEDLQNEGFPTIVVPPEFDRYRYANFEHEAGYDSLLTAKIAIRASARMEREGTYQQEQHEHTVDFKPHITNFGFATGGIRSVNKEIESSVSNVRHEQGNHSLVVDPIMENQPPSALPVELIAVKEKRQSSTNTIHSGKVAEVKSAFAKTTIYDVLEDHHEAQHMPGESIQDQLVNRSQSQDRDRQSTMRKKGELMPHWDSDFWSTFGNRLQVNGCKEGICRL